MKRGDTAKSCTAMLILNGFLSNALFLILGNITKTYLNKEVISLVQKDSQTNPKEKTEEIVLCNFVALIPGTIGGVFYTVRVRHDDVSMHKVSAAGVVGLVILLITACVRKRSRTH